MKLFEQLRTLIFRGKENNGRRKIFKYPYSDDPQIKREEIWQNLQNGLLLEDTAVFVPWNLPFYAVESIKERKKERADRTEWYLGKRTILGGYEAHLELMRWKFADDEKPIKRLSENLGRDDEGLERFNYLKKYLTGLFGAPTKEQLQKFGNADIGEISWENGDVALTLVGIEHFDLRYTFYIGVKSANQVY